MISMDKKYRTRDGQSVRVLCIDRDTKYPVVTLVGDDEAVYSYTSEGCFDSTGEVTRHDLVEISPYENFKLDEPVMVTDFKDAVWVPKHFAGVSKVTGKPMTWAAGTTSYTALGDVDSVEEWSECRRPTEKELNRNKPKD